MNRVRFIEGVVRIDLGAVSNRPATLFGATPASLHETDTGCRGLVFTSERYTASVFASREADALTAGIELPPSL